MFKLKDLGRREIELETSMPYIAFGHRESKKQPVDADRLLFYALIWTAVTGTGSLVVAAAYNGEA